jgi:hypothetical protein
VLSIHRRLNSTELGRLYERATLLLNLAEAQHVQVPAKTFELLALGGEQVFPCEPDSDPASLVQGIAGISGVSSKDLDVLLAYWRTFILRTSPKAHCGPHPREVSQFKVDMLDETPPT